jgi:hypothetical protein
MVEIDVFHFLYQQFCSKKESNQDILKELVDKGLYVHRSMPVIKTLPDGCIKRVVYFPGL